MKNYNFCNNCGKLGHLFHQCKLPITSIGIIAFRIKNNTIEYLLIRRKDSLGFVDFLRGKYLPNNKEYLINLLSKMTISEKNFILNAEFSELWNHLWGENIGIQYRSEEKNSYEKFNNLKNGITLENGDKYNLHDLINESNNKFYNYEEPEWGFPKGRRNYQEKDITCALREFEEETGFDKSDLFLIQNILPLEEIYTGSNFKSYKHKYFIAFISENSLPKSKFQESEVSTMDWKSLEATIQHIRTYNLEKIDLIKQVNKILERYNLYS
jgi:8-oxo-dGTP pyrophosphatase MutT (NUDIX family)